VSLSLSVRHDFGAGSERALALSDRLSRAMRDATPDAVRVVEGAVAETVADRTGMGREQAEAIVEAEVEETLGNTSRGRVGLKDPPDRFYPKTAKALSFVLPDGRKVTVRSVRGSRPYKLVERGAGHAEGAVRGVYEAKVMEALRG
jgi:hypothetical protein